MLNAAGTIGPSVLLAGQDAMLDELTKRLQARGVGVRYAPAEMAAEVVWMTAPHLVVAMGDAVADGGAALCQALSTEPASARTPVLMIRRGRVPRGVETLASIAPILGAERISGVVSELASELLDGLRDGEILQRRVSATLHQVERKAAFSHLYDSGVRPSQQNSAHPQQEANMFSGTRLDKQAVRWTQPPDSAEAAPPSGPSPAKQPAQPLRRPMARPERRTSPTLDMDPNFGSAMDDDFSERETREMPLPSEMDARETLPQSPFARSEVDTRETLPKSPFPRRPRPRTSDHTMLGMGAVTGGVTVPAPPRAPAVPMTPAAPAAPAPDAWEAEDAFADLAIELGTSTASRSSMPSPVSEPSGMRVLRKHRSDAPTVNQMVEPEHKKAR